MENEKALKRDAALLELLVKTYGADTIKKEIRKAIIYDSTQVN